MLYLNRELLSFSMSFMNVIKRIYYTMYYISIILAELIGYKFTIVPLLLLNIKIPCFILLF